MVEQDTGIRVGDETADILDKIADTKTEDFGEIMKIAGATPAEFKKFISKGGLPPGDKRDATNLLNEYRSRVEKFVDAAIADGRPYLDRKYKLMFSGIALS